MEGDGNQKNYFFESVISIHSLRMEGDWRPTKSHKPQVHFNPLPPHGGRPNTIMNEFIKELFQSTPSAWRETFLRRPEHLPGKISIHSLRMEGDW